MFPWPGEKKDNSFCEKLYFFFFNKLGGKLLSLKSNEVLTQATTWTDLEDIMPGAISQTREDRHCTIPPWGTWSSQIPNDGRWSSGYQGLGAGGGGEAQFSGDRVSVRGDEQVPEVEGSNGGMTTSDRSSCHHTVHLKMVKMVHLMLCIFYPCICNLLKKQTR